MLIIEQDSFIVFPSGIICIKSEPFSDFQLGSNGFTLYQNMSADQPDGSRAASEQTPLVGFLSKIITRITTLFFIGRPVCFF